MRNNIRQLLIIALVASQVLSMSACSWANKDREPLPDRPVSAVVDTTNEFTPTGEDEWNESDFRRFWFAQNEDTFKSLLDTLVLSQSVTTGNKTINLYKVKSDDAATAKEYIIMGNDLFSADHLMDANHLDSQTGKKLWFVETKEEKTNLLNTDYSNGIWVNGIRQGVLTMSDMFLDVDDVRMINLTVLCNAAGLEIKQNGQTVSIQNHYLPECNQPVVIEASDKLQQVIDPSTGNMYYAVVFLNNGSFSTQEVIRNIIGWDISITDSAIVVWTDDVYRPTDETVIVYSSEQSESSSTDSPESEAPDDTHEEESSEPYSEEPPADSQEDTDRQNQDIANQNSQAQQGTITKLPKTFDELTPEQKKAIVDMFIEVYNCTEAEAIEHYNSVSRETTSNPQNNLNGMPTGGPPSSLWK